MVHAQCVGLAEDVVYPLKPPLLKQQGHIQEKKNLWTKGPEWNNAAYDEKEKYYYFTHTAVDHTNLHPHFNQRKRMGTWKKEETHTRSKKR